MKPLRASLVVLLVTLIASCACVPVSATEVEHYNVDRHYHYLAADQLERIVAFAPRSRVGDHAPLDLNGCATRVSCDSSSVKLNAQVVTRKTITKRTALRAIDKKSTPFSSRSV
jgi:hypothetical protein